MIVLGSYHLHLILALNKREGNSEEEVILFTLC